MIGWLTRRADRATRKRAAKILTALGDGNTHYVVNDLDKATGIHAGTMYPALARLEAEGRIESGWVEIWAGQRRRRWYRLTDPLNQPTEGAAP